MQSKITWPTRLIALGFIGLIFIMNFWLHSYLFGGEMSDWVHTFTNLSIVMVFIGGFGKIWLWFTKKLAKSHDK